MVAAAVILVAALHLGFMVLEMFLWTTPIGRRVFAQSREQAAASRVLAANQGLYNGFLAVGLIWGVWLGAAGRPFVLFLLGCVVVAGVFGAATANWRILLVQSLPGAAALALVIWAFMGRLTAALIPATAIPIALIGSVAAITLGKQKLLVVDFRRRWSASV